MIPKKADLQRSLKSRFNGMNVKFAIKEKKADKRKEKSRVAAQIRRNKESQTLILLQNALPIGLPSPNQMLEKSIVIRIAGQTLFLLKSLDQVLGMSDWLTVPLISSNFLAFFTDNIGQIVYASPNIQSVLDQHHWSNLIGISIFDIMDFKSRWPVAGDVIKLKLLSNPNTSCDYKPTKTQVTPMSFSPSLSYPSYSRSTIVSKLSLRCSPSVINPCLIYTVWCSTNISHTNSRLRLLLLRQVNLQSEPTTALSLPESSNPLAFTNTDTLTLDRSLSWPSTFSAQKPDIIDLDSKINQKACIQKRFLVSVHDRKYNFEAVSPEFCKIVSEPENELVDQNLLDIIHIDDVHRIKSFLDSIIDKRDNNVWTPIFRIMCKDARYCMVKTLAKQFSSSCSQSIILHHKVIRTGLNYELSTKYGMYEVKKKSSSPQNVISHHTPNQKSKTLLKLAPYIMCQNSIHPLFHKRKPSDPSCLNGSLSHLTDSENRIHSFIKRSYKESENDFEMTIKPHILTQKKELSTNNSNQEKDPFLPTYFERYLNIFSSKFRQENNYKTNRPKSIFINKVKLAEKSILQEPFENESNCSASHSLESCVLTSPSPDSVGISIDDQFIWDFPDSLNEITQTNHWLDDPYQNDLELILPI